ncbi:type VI-B CRISPR-associated RNA-guided ribonuclease Cas13b [Flavobacterium inviolabile]|uniref:type VI-B CRISPR-associated RNA-guided ribonuclease Cas13b n=1 Tax=Flavobacterium inviolabile TaxID=2748320 RepID=UPI0015AE1D84|nr:type VI-B CRISPR-associated RNA-guided ribonuclease Cas13b [Flavobacterium inviolabile]
MEGIVLKNNKIEFDHSLLKDKHFFAGYLNLAQNNIDQALEAYKVRFGVKANEKDNFSVIDNLDIKKLSEPDYINRIDFLKLHFPVVGYLDLPVTNDLFKNEIDKNLARRLYFKENFKVLVKTIDSLRNFYTHYYHKSLPFDKKLFTLVDEIFLQVILDVKRLKKKNDHTRQFLKQSLKEEYPILFNLKKKDLQDKKAKGKKVSLDTVSINNAVFNDAFFHLLYQKDQLNPFYKSALLDGEHYENTISISQNGLLFLLGMFLNKKEGEDLRSQIKGFKGKVVKDHPEFPNAKNNSFRFMATHWVFSYLAFKGIRQKISTAFDKETLLIQIVDELSKVPDEVYNNLSFEKQQQFVEDINEYIKEGNETERLNDAIVIHPVIRKRYENKFNYFVLRYLDEFAGFPSLRFQIHLGNYVHDRRIKNIAGTSFETDRIVKEKINVFGNLSEVGNLKADYFEKNEALATDSGWEIFPNPSYNFVSENIPIFINLQKSKVPGAAKLFGQIKSKQIKVEKEDGNQRAESKYTKEQMTTLIDPNIKGQTFEKIYIGPPTAMLSLNELPALLYELLVRKVSPEAIENTMIQKLMDRFSTIEKYAPSDKLSASQITKNLRRSDVTEKIDTEKLQRSIEKEIKICDEKLATISQNRKDTRVPHHKRMFIFTNKELGSEATWLTDDLIRFMPKDARENWKGYQHSQLQQSLAYFNQNTREAFSLLQSVWDFKDTNYNWNSGIQKAFISCKHFDMLLERYLNNRKDTLTAMYEGVRSFSSNTKMLKKLIEQQNIWTVFNKRLFQINPIDQQKERLLAKPLVFPRGIFDEKPTFIKDSKPTEQPEAFADWYRYTYKAHPYQRFYELERNCDLLFEQNQLSNEYFSTNKKNLSKAEQLELFQLKQDLKIKKVKNQDLFLKLIAEAIYNKTFEHDTSLSLSDFYLTQEERLEKEANARRQSERQKNDTSENIIKDNFIWSKTISIKDGQVYAESIKLKDIGKFRRFLNDSKVKTILSYDPNRRWTKQELEDELSIKRDSYETIRREELLKEIQLFEKSILESYNFDGQQHPTDLEYENNPKFKHYVVNGVLRKRKLAPEDEIQWLLDCTEKQFDKLTLAELTTKTDTIQKAFLLIIIRNKFAHNQLPKGIFYSLIKKHTYPDGVGVSNDKTASSVILEFTRSVIAMFRD